MLVKLII